MEWFRARLKERSTWYGLGVIIAGVASHLAPEQWASVLAGILYVMGGAAVVTPGGK